MDMIIDLTINKKIIQFINAKVLSGLYQSMNNSRKLEKIAFVQPSRVRLPNLLN